MTDTGNTREVIPGGEQPFWSYEHLVPIAKFLIEERGHSMFPKTRTVVSYEWGFMNMNGLQCRLTRRITREDWVAVNERFVLPDTIFFMDGRIRDNLNDIEFIGVERMLTDDGLIPIEEWEEQQRALGKMP